MTSSLRRHGAVAVRILSLLVVLAYCASAALFTLPVSPIKIEYQQALDASIGRFLYQNWNVFAPNPISGDYMVLVACLDGRDSAIESPTDIPADAWNDLSSPLWIGLQEHRVSAYDRLARIPSNLARDFAGPSSSLTEWAMTCVGGDQDACDRFERRFEAQQAIATGLLVRVATAYCKDAYPDVSANRVAIRVRNREVVPWSRRHTDDAREVSDFDVGVFPVARDVVAPGIYRRAPRRDPS